MELSNAIKLIEAGVNKTQPGTWADLGAGAGLFTRALATLLPKGSTIYAVDANKSALEKIKATDGIELIKINADFEHLTEAKISTASDVRDNPRDLNGILMANSLHFVKDKFLSSKKQVPG